MRALDHPNIVNLLEVIDTEETLFIVMEYLSGGDMWTHLQDHGRMTEAEARGPFRQLVSAPQHCHQRGIVHRDLKPENLLLDAQMNVKISDFGLSKKCEEGERFETSCGTLAYAALEMFLGESYYGPAVDVWSLGVILYTVVTGSRPFRGRYFGDVRQQILGGQYCIPLYLPPQIRTLFKIMIVVNPSDRSSTEDLLRPPWVNMGQEEPLQPACEENPGVPVAKTLGSRRDQMQESTGSESSDDPEVGGSLSTVGSPWAWSSSGPSSFHSEPSRIPEVSSLNLDWLYSAGDGLLPKDQESGQMTSKPTCPPPSLGARTATPSPASQCGPGAFFSTSKTGSKTGAPEEATAPQVWPTLEAPPTLGSLSVCPKPLPLARARNRRRGWLGEFGTVL
ncbi:serine/threonine-protein kinase MARK1-like isoform X2 [Hippopotamus amphibius kiboko]|nr:serine/threonine-protein kinase MARK1-like isoform X2 [Hippopotamus amphibius kiboko]